MIGFKQQHPWLAREIKKKYWEALSRLFPDKLMRFRLSGLDISLYLYLNDPVSKLVFLESFEVETLEFLKKYVKKADCVFDIGANIGIYSILASKLVGPEGHVHVFEPSIRELSVLIRNLELNNVSNVVMNNLAVWDESSAIEMNIMDSANLGVYNTFGEITHPKAKNKPFSKVMTQAINLDAYTNFFNLRPNLIKIDTEGAELRVLRGGKNLFSRPDAPWIILEACPVNLEGFHSKIQDIIELLTNIYNYRLFNIDTSGSLIPFKLEANDQYSINIVAAKN